MNTKLNPAPHRPPLIHIRNKKFRMLNCQYIYPIVYNSEPFLNPDNSFQLGKINFLSAPYYQENDIFNVYVSYMSERKTTNIINTINSYYDIKCTAIKMLRIDMEYYSKLMNIPLVVIRNYNKDTDFYELSYFSKPIKEKMKSLII
uniref:Uncharacterized protein n=1 Tax=viral metagenome TaxID=1070528 RepID=A0A6C0M214_9ZZZZ